MATIILPLLLLIYYIKNDITKNILKLTERDISNAVTQQQANVSNFGGYNIG